MSAPPLIAAASRSRRFRLRPIPETRLEIDCVDASERVDPPCFCHATPRHFFAALAAAAPATASAQLPGPLARPIHWSCWAGMFPRVREALESGTLSELIGAGRLEAPVVVATEAALRRECSPLDAASVNSRRRATTPQALALVNGRVFTGDPARPWAKAVAIRDGRFAVVGSDEEVAAAGASERIDLGGRLVIPGLNDAHMHHTPDPAGVRLALDPVASTWAEVRAAVTEAAASTPPGRWIFGALGIEAMNDPQAGRDALDAAAPAHPVLLLGFTNHVNVVNTAAMARLGIGEREPDPLGGRHERRPGSDVVTGRFHEYAQWGPQRAFAMMASDDEAVTGSRALAAECLRYGITTIQNMSWVPAARSVAMLERADLALRVRVIRFPPASGIGRLPHEDAALAPGHANERITVSGVKWILDGTPVERGAALERGYADRPDEAGRLNFDAAQVAQMLSEARRAGEPLLLHAIGARTIALVLDAMEADRRTHGAMPMPVRLEHGDGLTPAQVVRAAALGLQVVQNPSHFLFAELYAARFGEGVPYAALRSLQEAGLTLALGSDGPLNPFLGIMAACLNPARPEEAITREAAVVAYTRGGAEAEGRGHEKGMIAEGFLADLAVLSQDIFTVPPQALPATESLLTVVGGAIAHRGALT